MKTLNFYNMTSGYVHGAYYFVRRGKKILRGPSENCYQVAAICSQYLYKKKKRLHIPINPKFFSYLSDKMLHALINRVPR